MRFEPKRIAFAVRMLLLAVFKFPAMCQNCPLRPLPAQTSRPLSVTLPRSTLCQLCKADDCLLLRPEPCSVRL